MQNVLSEAQSALRSGDRSRAVTLLRNIACHIAGRLAIEFDINTSVAAERSAVLNKLAEKTDQREKWRSAKGLEKNTDALTSLTYLSLAAAVMQKHSGGFTDADVRAFLRQTEVYLPVFIKCFPDARLCGRLMEDVTKEFDGKRITLRSEHSGRYVYSDEDEHKNAPLFCATEKAAAWEIFRVRVLPDNWAVLRAHNGCWVADVESSGLVKAHRDAAYHDFEWEQYHGYKSSDEEFKWEDDRSYLWSYGRAPVYPDAHYGTRRDDCVKLRFYRLGGVYYLRTLGYDAADPSHALYPSPTSGFWVTCRFDIPDKKGRIPLRSGGRSPDAWETFLIDIV